jgi:RNA polymerase sigma-70 factor (ECF subfamily)
MPHLGDLFKTAAHVIGNRTEAEDVVQEAYLQAWKSFDRFQLGTNCRAWLFKILFNVISHHRRKWFGLRLVADKDEYIEDTLRYEPPVPPDIKDEDVLAALERVPQKYREVVLLSDVQEFSYKEIAETLSIPVGTVMSRISRGRQQLRVELADFAGIQGIDTRAEKGKTA